MAGVATLGDVSDASSDGGSGLDEADNEVRNLTSRTFKRIATPISSCVDETTPTPCDVATYDADEAVTPTPRDVTFGGKALTTPGQEPDKWPTYVELGIWRKTQHAAARASTALLLSHTGQQQSAHRTTTATASTTQQQSAKLHAAATTTTTTTKSVHTAIKIAHHGTTHTAGSYQSTARTTDTQNGFTHSTGSQKSTAHTAGSRNSTNPTNQYHGTSPAAGAHSAHQGPQLLVLHTAPRNNTGGPTMAGNTKHSPHTMSTTLGKKEEGGPASAATTGTRNAAIPTSHAALAATHSSSTSPLTKPHSPATQASNPHYTAPTVTNRTFKQQMSGSTTSVHTSTHASSRSITHTVSNGSTPNATTPNFTNATHRQQPSGSSTGADAIISNASKHAGITHAGTDTGTPKAATHIFTNGISKQTSSSVVGAHTSAPTVSTVDTHSGSHPAGSPSHGAQLGVEGGSGGSSSGRGGSHGGGRGRGRGGGRGGGGGGPVRYMVAGFRLLCRAESPPDDSKDPKGPLGDAGGGGISTEQSPGLDKIKGLASANRASVVEEASGNNEGVTRERVGESWGRRWSEGGAADMRLKAARPLSCSTEQPAISRSIGARRSSDSGPRMPAPMRTAVEETELPPGLSGKVCGGGAAGGSPHSSAGSSCGPDKRALDTGAVKPLPKTQWSETKGGSSVSGGGRGREKEGETKVEAEVEEVARASSHLSNVIGRHMRLERSLSEGADSRSTGPAETIGPLDPGSSTHPLLTGTLAPATGKITPSDMDHWKIYLDTDEEVFEACEDGSMGPGGAAPARHCDSQEPVFEEEVAIMTNDAELEVRLAEAMALGAVAVGSWDMTPRPGGARMDVEGDESGDTWTTTEAGVRPGVEQFGGSFGSKRRKRRSASSTRASTTLSPAGDMRVGNRAQGWAQDIARLLTPNLGDKEKGNEDRGRERCRERGRGREREENVHARRAVSLDCLPNMRAREREQEKEKQKEREKQKEKQRRKAQEQMRKERDMERHQEQQRERERERAKEWEKERQQERENRRAALGKLNEAVRALETKLALKTRGPGPVSTAASSTAPTSPNCGSEPSQREPSGKVPPPGPTSGPNYSSPSPHTSMPLPVSAAEKTVAAKAPAGEAIPGHTGRRARLARSLSAGTPSPGEPVAWPRDQAHSRPPSFRSVLPPSAKAKTISGISGVTGVTGEAAATAGNEEKSGGRDITRGPEGARGEDASDGYFTMSPRRPKQQEAQQELPMKLDASRQQQQQKQQQQAKVQPPSSLLSKAQHKPGPQKMTQSQKTPDQKQEQIAQAPDKSLLWQRRTQAQAQATTRPPAVAQPPKPPPQPQTQPPRAQQLSDRQQSQMNASKQAQPDRDPQPNRKQPVVQQQQQLHTGQPQEPTQAPQPLNLQLQRQPQSEPPFPQPMHQMQQELPQPIAQQPMQQQQPMKQQPTQQHLMQQQLMQQQALAHMTPQYPYMMMPQDVSSQAMMMSQLMAPLMAPYTMSVAQPEATVVAPPTPEPVPPPSAAPAPHAPGTPPRSPMSPESMAPMMMMSPEAASQAAMAARQMMMSTMMMMMMANPAMMQFQQGAMPSFMPGHLMTYPVGGPPAISYPMSAAPQFPAGAMMPYPAAYPVPQFPPAFAPNPMAPQYPQPSQYKATPVTDTTPPSPTAKHPGEAPYFVPSGAQPSSPLGAFPYQNGSH